MNDNPTRHEKQPHAPRARCIIEFIDLDHGGDTAKMQQLNVAMDQIRKQLNEVGQ